MEFKEKSLEEFKEMIRECAAERKVVLDEVKKEVEEIDWDENPMCF